MLLVWPLNVIVQVNRCWGVKSFGTVTMNIPT